MKRLTAANQKRQKTNNAYVCPMSALRINRDLSGAEPKQCSCHDNIIRFNKIRLRGVRLEVIYRWK